MRGQPARERDTAPADHHGVAQLRQLGDDASLLALVLAGKLVLQVPGDVGRALERPAHVEHAHGRAVGVGGVEQQREAKAGARDRDATPAQDGHGQEVHAHAKDGEGDECQDGYGHAAPWGFGNDAHRHESDGAGVGMMQR